MKLDFLGLSPEEKHLYIEQAAIRRNVSSVIIEKDFWVCWLLSILFESEFADSLVFKGGTSLSKVFGVIDRFSEDININKKPFQLLEKAFCSVSTKQPLQLDLRQYQSDYFDI